VSYIVEFGRHVIPKRLSQNVSKNLVETLLVTHFVTIQSRHI